MDVVMTRTEGLGDATYLLRHEGVAMLVDPQRDYTRFLGALDGAELRFVVETHLHNDYVSGGKSAAEETGAELVLPAGAGTVFPYRPAFHREDVDAGSFVVTPLHTPGHTPEHVSYVIVIEGEAVAVFSGGSLLVGSAGRTDLLGEPRARQLARLQYVSVTRLAELPRSVALYPTHGEGSFCAAGGAGRHTSTIGDELDSSPVLKYADADSFADGQLAGLEPYPTYYARMGPINLTGPTPMPAADPQRVGILALEEFTGPVVDMRPRAEFASGHIPGSIGIELNDQFGTWAGWLIDAGAPIVLITNGRQDVTEATTQLGRIGMDRVAGIFDDLDGWRAGGRPLRAFRTMDVEGFRSAIHGDDPLQVLDVRSPSEHAAGSVPGAVHQYLPDLVSGMPDGLDPTRPVGVICASGHRASIAAGLLERHGFEPAVLIQGGVADLVGR
jgi:hydroxyacylglutathione hydrolase